MRVPSAMGKTADVQVLQGFGPFYVVSRTPQMLELARNPNFWGNGSKTALARIRLTLINDPAARP